MVLIQTKEYSLIGELLSNSSEIAKNSTTDTSLVKTTTKKTAEVITKTIAAITSSSSSSSVYSSTSSNSLISNNQDVLFDSPVIDTDSKLIDSVSLLKSIIDKITKLENANRDRKNDALDASFDSIFAFAKNSVTLSFKDYISLHKSSTSTARIQTTLGTNTNTPFLLSFLTSSTSSPSFVSSSLLSSSSSSSSSSSQLSTSTSQQSLLANYFTSDKLPTQLNQHKSNSILPVISISKTPSYLFEMLKMLYTNSTQEINKLSDQLSNSNISSSGAAIAPVSFIDMATNLNKDALLDLKIFKNAPYLADLNLTSQFSSTTVSPISTSSFSDITMTNSSTLLIGIAFFYSILVITSLTSNPLLIYVLLWRRKAQIKLIDIFVANLSLSDLFLTIFNIPLCLIIYFSEQWPFGSLLCQLGTYSTSCSIYVNIFTMAYISIDRYFAVTRPLISNPSCQLRKKSILLDNKTRRKIYFVLTMIWIIAMILSIPQFLFSKVSNTNKKIFGNDHNLSHLNTTKNLFISKNMSKALDNIEEIDSIFLRDNYDDPNSINGIEFGEDPFKRCILEYPLKNMKNYMILINFSLQYLIPSIVILYFYGKIIYHLYLNLNVEELMESPVAKQNSTHSNHNGRLTFRFLGRLDKSSVKSEKGQSFIKVEPNSLTVAGPSSSANQAEALLTPTGNLQRKRSRMRIEGLNRTRNLKKSIKVMIIIIALFLLSWLPNHLYRLVTAFYPIIINLLDQSFLSKSSGQLNGSEEGVFGGLDDGKQALFNLTINEGCIKNNITYCKEWVFNALKELRDPNDTINLNYKLNTLHNRYVFFFCYFMAMSSVCYNPIVYFWMHKKFRAEVKQLFNRIFNVSFRLNNNNNNNNTINNSENRTSTRLPNINLNATRTSSSLNVRPNSTATVTTMTNLSSKTNKLSIVSKPSTSYETSDSAYSSKYTRNVQKQGKKLVKSNCVTSIKIKNNRFNSLSSESTVSSSKKSEYI